MKRTRLLAALVGLGVLAFLAPDALARNRMYNPSTGTFMQRDPLGTPLESPLIRNVSSPQFTRRDPTVQYYDGMNLYQYVRSNPLRWRDPRGLKVVANCSEPGKWSAIAIDYGVTAGNEMNPDVASNAIKVAALLEFMGNLPQDWTDMLGSAVESIASGEPPTSPYPGTTVEVAQLIQKIIRQERAFFWVQAWCLKCECDKDGSSGYAWHPKHQPWHQATFSDIDTGGKPKEWFGLNKDIVQTAGAALGMIQMQSLRKGDLQDLKQAANAEVQFKANEICSKSAK